MVNIFVKTTIEYMKKGKFEDYFPLNNSLISKIIFTNIKKFEPNLTVYKSYTNISDAEFSDIFIGKLIDECNKGNFDLIKHKKKEDLLNDKMKLYSNDLENKLIQLNINKFSFFNFDEIFNDKSYDLIKLKFNLFNDKYLFFINNDNKLLAFNYNKFTSFNKDDFYNNNYYYKDCFKEIEIESQISNININDSNEIFELNSNNIFNIQDTNIKFINDENSLKFFKNKSKFFEVLSIDIEGQFDTSYKDIKINLIQICDDTNLKNEIYVLDFYSMKKASESIFSELSIILKSIFENKNIKKIFFDGRSDILSLHKELKVCTKNFIDLSALYNSVNSYEKQYELKLSKKDINEKSLIKCLNICKQNYYFKGLNKVLKDYHSKNCINPLKTKYHQLFDEKDFYYWAQRPIIEEFLLYSALDVKYEYDTYNNLKNKLKEILEKFYEIKDINNNNIDLIILLISCPNHNYACNKHIASTNEIK